MTDIHIWLLDTQIISGKVFVHCGNMVTVDVNNVVMDHPGLIQYATCETCILLAFAKKAENA